MYENEKMAAVMADPGPRTTAYRGEEARQTIERERSFIKSVENRLSNIHGRLTEAGGNLERLGSKAFGVSPPPPEPALSSGERTPSDYGGEAGELMMHMDEVEKAMRYVEIGVSMLARHLG